MRRILFRRALRDLRANRVRYLALGFMLVLSMYLVVSIVGAADTLIAGTARHAAQNRVEDGQFSVFVPLTEAEIRGIEALGATVEPAFSLDCDMADGSVLRVFRVREQIDLMELVAGALPASADEAALERRYCEVKGIAVGDEIEIGGSAFRVCGIGATPDYDAPYRTLGDSAVDNESFGAAFVRPEAYRRLARAGGGARTEEFTYAYRLNGRTTDSALEDYLKGLTFDPKDVDDAFFRDYWDRTLGRKDELLDGAADLEDGANELRDALSELTKADSLASVLMEFLPDEVSDGLRDMADGSAELADGMADMREALEELAEEYLEGGAENLTRFLPAADNLRIGGAADDQAVNLYAGLLAGVLILVLLTYVISVFSAHGIDEESSVIGTLYALGVRRSELMRHYMLSPVAVTLAGGALGTALGYSALGVPVQMRDCYAYFSLPDLQTMLNPWLAIYGVAMPPLVAALVNGIVIRRKLSAPALRLMRHERRAPSGRGLRLGRMGFVGRFRLRQLMREGRSAIAICLGMLITLLLVMLGMNAYVMCDHIRVDNVRDTRFEYMYLYKYPEERVPEGGSPAYAETLKRRALGYDLDVTLLGIEPGNPYFDAAPEESLSRVQITSAMAQKFGLAVGDVFTLSDRQAERDYAFTVSGIVRYSPGFFAFMDIGSMRKLFNMPVDHWNAVFSARALDIPAGRLYSVTSRKDIVAASDVFVDLMKPMVYTMTGCAALIFAIVMYLMMKVMLDRSAYSIALMKIFGYRRGEIRALYLDGGFLLVALGAALCLPAAKGIMDAMYPMLIANVACGMDLSFPWQLYAGIYGAILLLYCLINALLVRRIHRVQPAVVLKNRE